MRTIIFTFTAIFSSILLIAQNSPIDFEEGGLGADWTWTVFENDVNPALEIIPNPDASGINTSATVAKFTALDLGAPFAGCESMHGTDLGVYTLSAANSFVTIMVWKPIISDVGIKMVTTSGGALPEIKIPNTLVNQWELITFNFSSYINNAIYAIEDVDQIVVFPDFTDRNEDRIIYFDNITIGDGTTTSLTELQANPLNLGPNPTSDFLYNQSDLKIDQVNVYDISGRLVISTGQLSPGEFLDIRTLEDGNYIVRAMIGSSEASTRFVKN